MRFFKEIDGLLLEFNSVRQWLWAVLVVRPVGRLIGIAIIVGIVLLLAYLFDVEVPYDSFKQLFNSFFE